MNCCQKHLPKKPVIVVGKHPCKCQGLCLMREFSKKNKYKCKALEITEPSQIKKEFVTGSFYEGDWTPECSMHGNGLYTFTNGVVYEGEFKDGVMHGQGELRYQTHCGQAIVRGQWIDGKITERKIFFDDDTLEYDDHNWQYCKAPDRRYSKEYDEGLRPAGKSYHTAEQPPREIPQDCFDTGDGFYDRHRLSVYDHKDLTKIIRGPSSYERKWIRENCRFEAKVMNIGPRQDFYEEFVEPRELLEPNPPPPVKYTGKKKLSPFEEDYDVKFSMALTGIALLALVKHYAPSTTRGSVLTGWYATLYRHPHASPLLWRRLGHENVRSLTFVAIFFSSITASQETPAYPSISVRTMAWIKRRLETMTPSIDSSRT